MTDHDAPAPRSIPELSHRVGNYSLFGAEMRPAAREGGLGAPSWADGWIEERTVQQNGCPAGCHTDIVTIALHGASGADITLTSCSGCDRRWWRRNGTLVDLDEILEELSPSALRRAS